MMVRNAELEDMKRLGHIMAVSFRTAFSAFVTQQTLDACAREENCAALLEGIFREGGMRFLIGGDSGMLCWQEGESGAEIVAIHTLPESWGTGLGGAMLEAALSQIGNQPVYLWAFQENKRARRFYEKHGFRWDGCVRISEFDGAVEVRYVSGEPRFAPDPWVLRELQIIYKREHSAVWAGESDLFGPVILKWNGTGGLAPEYVALRHLQGGPCCQVYAYDEARGLLLEERILPGTLLRREPSPEKRIEVLAGVFREIHLPRQRGETYLDWLDRACAFCRSHKMPGNLARMAEEARKSCGELFASCPERVLLHGDLHHDNLLRREDGSYAVIDPKGVVGPEILDLPRFLLNERDLSDDPAHMEGMISLACRAFGYPEEDLKKALFLEAVLANVWLVEDGLPVQERWMEIARSLCPA